MVNIVMHWKRHIGVGPIHRAWGGKYKMFHIMMATTLKYIHKPHKIRLHVGMGIGQGISNPGLGGKIHHHINAGIFKDGIKGG